MSPVVLLMPRLFSGPHQAPTLEGQSVLKDVVLVAATLVLATTLRGARLTDDVTPVAGEIPAATAAAASHLVQAQ